MSPRTWTALAATSILACTGCASPSMPVTASAPAAVAGFADVDCDGVPDLVGGTMTGDAPAAGQAGSAGVVYVRYGGTGRVQRIGQNEIGDPAPAAGGRFAGTVVVADLDRDGCSDVIVSDPTATGGGKVWALWGSTAGLDPERSRLLVAGAADEQLGWVLAFVPEPQPVLVVSREGAPRRSLRLYPVTRDGSLGTYRDLDAPSPTDRSAWYVDTFAETLSADGDLLVVGSPEYSDEGSGYPGEVFVVRLLAGLDYRVTRITQESAGVPGGYRLHDGFGSALSVRDGRLAIGVPGGNEPGQVQVYAVTGDVPRLSWEATLTTASLGLGGPPSRDEFGATVRLYRPCDGIDGLLVVDPARGSGGALISSPLQPTASCPARVIADRLVDRRKVTVVPSRTDAADTAVALVWGAHLRLDTAGATTDATVPFEPYFDFAG